MRPRAWWLLGTLAAAVALAGPARDNEALQVLLGLVVVLAAGILATFLPWRRWLRWPAMPGLFARPGPGQQWCAGCGRPVPSSGCASCAPRAKRQAPNRQRSLRKRA